MTKRTKKVGIAGKYGTRYGSTIRKQIKEVEISQHQKYNCIFCGKNSVKRNSIGLWKCNFCRRSIAGGAWSLHTQAAVTVRNTIKRLRDLTDPAISSIKILKKTSEKKKPKRKKN